ncbi:MAG: flagellar hook-associated protein FlgK [Oscillospiraceae bacterium]|nr:flagellar hook-associated protein FlgK [Oscillospiraceae bacterium]
MLRPTFLNFETARRALNTAQAGLDVVGNNIGNVNTPGYTRQRAVQVSVHSSFQSQFQVHGGRGGFAGQGAEVSGISQVRDSYLDTRFRNEASTHGTLAVRAGGLNDIGRIIDEVSKTGLHDRIGDLVHQLGLFAHNADSPEIAVVLRNTAMAVTQTFNRAANDLAAVLQHQKFDLEVAVRDEVNTTLERIAFLNERIRQDHMFGSPANELMDERNLLIDNLSSFLPIHVVRTPEHLPGGRTIESLSIQLSGGGAAGQNITLVDNDVFNQLAVSQGEDGSASILLTDGRSGFTITDAGRGGDITGNITGGGIRGFLDIINGRGDFAGSGQNGFRGVPYYIESLNVIATTFAALMNQTNSISDADVLNNPQLTAQDRPLFASNPPGQPITAANITISANWMAEANWLTTTKQPIVQVPVLENGQPKFDGEGNQIFETQSNSDNILIFVNLLSSDTTFFRGVNGDGDQFMLFRGTFEESLTSMQSNLGLDASLGGALLDASELVLGGFADRRDSISAVSMDEEAVNMMILQNFYNAAARFMTVVDEALGTIIQNMGVVGR